MPPAQIPKKLSSRPRKYTKEAAVEAKRVSNQRSRQRKHLLHPPSPVDFIAYKPTHPDVPTNTPASGLRTSPDIPIPIEDNTQEANNTPNTRPISLPPIQLPDDAITAHINLIRQNEREINLERDKYESEIY
jgi:hypothetical protein